MNYNVKQEQFSEKRAGEHSERTRHSDAGIRTGACYPILIKVILEKI
jgi:hypothetical protein